MLSNLLAITTKQKLKGIEKEIYHGKIIYFKPAVIRRDEH
jgi:hypothetical protein